MIYPKDSFDLHPASPRTLDRFGADPSDEQMEAFFGPLHNVPRREPMMRTHLPPHSRLR